MDGGVLSWHKVQRPILRHALHFAIGLTLFQGASYGQATRNQSDPLAAALERAKSGDVDISDVEVIAKAKALQAIPALEVQFARTTDLDIKTKIANGLVRLGDRDDTYWKFLLEQATLAVDSDIPDAVNFHGNVMDHDLSPELKAWAQAHHVDLNTAGQNAISDFPGKVLELGQTGDPRGIPLLRRALRSRNTIIVIMASKSLAQMQDKDSIPLIIEACRRSENGFDAGIAEASLIFFDDPRAQSAVDTYVPKERAKIWRDAIAHGLKPLGYDSAPE